MAYDRDLANRIRELLAGESVVEKAMFGGLAFLLNGNMSVAASGQGGLLVRSDPDDQSVLDEPGVSPMEMRGREMKGWLRVTADAVESDAAMARWVRHAVSYAKTLPPK
ncbi:TfoX/Sxy family protein [Smaragdicoccus niigatensis]|uniref:TfoX/Sxy family protein n=1 Tax=Smaragdicoccus niigatensis TaxID=359359 RepID=UPI000360F105|nr:TfoX/Sxy family protein [Smaragdicoccus niigatensis]